MLTLPLSPRSARAFIINMIITNIIFHFPRTQDVRKIRYLQIFFLARLAFISMPIGTAEFFTFLQLSETLI